MLPIKTTGNFPKKPTIFEKIISGINGRDNPFIKKTAIIGNTKKTETFERLRKGYKYTVKVEAK